MLTKLFSVKQVASLKLFDSVIQSKQRMCYSTCMNLMDLANAPSAVSHTLSVPASWVLADFSNCFARQPHMLLAPAKVHLAGVCLSDH